MLALCSSLLRVYVITITRPAPCPTQPPPISPQHHPTHLHASLFLSLLVHINRLVPTHRSNQSSGMSSSHGHCVLHQQQRERRRHHRPPRFIQRLLPYHPRPFFPQQFFKAQLRLHRMGEKTGLHNMLAVDGRCELGDGDGKKRACFLKNFTITKTPPIFPIHIINQTHISFPLKNSIPHSHPSFPFPLVSDSYQKPMYYVPPSRLVYFPIFCSECFS